MLIEYYFISSLFWMSFIDYFTLKRMYNSHIVHIIHAVVTVFLLYFNYNTFSLSFSFGYFVVELLSCIYNKDITYILHALCAIILILGCVFDYEYYKMEMYKILYIEISTPFLYLWKKYKTKELFMFFLVFFVIFRIIYLPCLVYKMIIYKLNIFSFILFVLSAMQFVWVSKMISIVFNYRN